VQTAIHPEPAKELQMASSTHHPVRPSIVLSTMRPALQAGQINTIDLLVRVQGPDAPSDDPMHTHDGTARSLALVIDSSGSMDGRPLEQAKRCAELVVSRLNPSDRVAVVQFDQTVRLLWPAVEVGDGRAVSWAIRSIESGGCTALHGGWMQGTQALAGVAGTGLRRVILLSDGEANEGETDPDVIARQCADWSAQGVSTSTYGLGNGFNEELMVAMARAGGGGQYFGRTADDLIGPFERELALINQLCLSDVRLSFKGAAGVSVEVLNDLPVVDGVYKLPDVAHGAEAWALVRLTVPAWVLDAAKQGSSLLQVTVSGRGADGESVLLDTAPLTMPVVSREAWQSLPSDELVQRRVTEVAAAQALDNMRAAAQRGDVAALKDMLRAARQEFAGSDWVRAILDSMERLANERDGIRFCAKELLYSSGTLKTRLRARQEQFEVNAVAEASMPAFLRRDPAQGQIKA
jgi:Ca-activated chloride channel family protein